MLFKFILENIPPMKKIYSYFFAALIVQLLGVSICFAQTINLKPAPANVNIDGKLTEWGDSLSYYNNETQINYTLANDKDNMYLVLKTIDPTQQFRILSTGVTLSIDPKGHKKPTYSVTFPFAEQESVSFADDYTIQEKKAEANLTKLKRIKADGFKDVESDIFTLENTYGFRVSINFDTHGFLVYEEVIPLKLFHADELRKNEWAFNIKINGDQSIIKKQAGDQDVNLGLNAGSGGQGGRGGNGRRAGGNMGGRKGDRSHSTGETSEPTKEAPKPIDFWGKFTLAKE